ncbi:MAG: hypothetical protein NW241_02300 [Bacteroidia bacterium]|nr:hypothetical protein [Bacteroidia bacterium]
MEDLARAFSHAFSLGANAIDLECGQGGDVPKLYCKPPAASPEPPAPPPSVPRRLSIPREFYKRCDRETASAALEHLFAQPPDRPKVLLIHGPEEESPASLAQRLAEDIRRERSAADEAAFVTDELTLRPDTSQEAFSYQIVRKLEVDHPEAAALFARRRQPLLILPVRVEWGDAVEPLLRWCLDAFWRTGIPAGREVFVLVQLIHQANKEKRGFSLFGSADPAKKLHKLIDACCALPVYARPVPLEPVARRHVKESLRKIGLIEDLHILQRVEAEVPDPAPMERVEAWLRQFAPPLT